MIKKTVSNAMRDPRHFQIVTLSSLLGLLMLWSAFAPSISVPLTTFSAALITQVLCTTGLNKFSGTNISYDLRSPMITALSLSILLKASHIWIYAFAAIIAIAFKFFIRKDGKHIFNPANIGIVCALLLFPTESWIAPAQWGTSLLLGAFLICMAATVLYRIPSRDISFMFIGFWGMLIFGRALWLGDPLSIPIHQIQSGALLIFTFFMISDPKTIPDNQLMRAVFALLVALGGFILQFEFQVFGGLFYSLAAICLIRPYLDRCLPERRFNWPDTLKPLAS